MVTVSCYASEGRNFLPFPFCLLFRHLLLLLTLCHRGKGFGIESLNAASGLLFIYKGEVSCVRVVAVPSVIFFKGNLKS